MSGTPIQTRCSLFITANILNILKSAELNLSEIPVYPTAKLKSEGYQLPLLEAHLSYVSAAFYDDILVIEASLKEIPKFKMKIDYKIFRKSNEELVCEGYTEHVFVKKETKRPGRPPKFFIDAVKNYYK